MKFTTAALISTGLAFSTWVILHLFWLRTDPIPFALAGLFSTACLIAAAYVEYRSIFCRDRIATIVGTSVWGIIGSSTVLQTIALWNTSESKIFILITLMAFLALTLACTHACWLVGIVNPSESDAADKMAK